MSPPSGTTTAVEPRQPRRHCGVLPVALVPDQHVGAARAGAGNAVKIASRGSADSPIARTRARTEIELGLILSGLGYKLLVSDRYTLAERKVPSESPP